MIITGDEKGFAVDRNFIIGAIWCLGGGLGVIGSFWRE